MEHLEKEIKKVSDTTSKPVPEVVAHMINDLEVIAPDPKVWTMWKYFKCSQCELNVD